MSEANNAVKFYYKLKFLCGDNANWILNPTKNDLLQLGEEFLNIFDNLSKTGKGRGYPDIFLYDKNKKIIIIGEIKEQLINHGEDNNYNEKNAGRYAVDGIKHYLNKIKEKKLKDKLGVNFIGLALSGNVEKSMNYKISTFSITNENVISDNWSTELLNITEYANSFKSLKKENNMTRVKIIASEVHELMRDIPVAERPIFLAGIVIALYENEGLNLYPGDIKKRIKNDPLDIDYAFIKRNLKEDIKKVLIKAGISPIEKIESVNIHISKILKILENKSIKNDVGLIREIFIKINSIMDVLVEDLEYEIMGNFYQEFLRYSSGDGADLGIILTPTHITELMVELIDIFKEGGINENDIVLDPCCGTGTFLVSFMNKQISKYAIYDYSKKDTIKTKNLIGVEINPTMYVLAIANMLVRGDGKSSIFEEDIFTINSNKIKNEDNKKPTIGLMNPPYSQSKKKKAGNNKSEMEFIEKLLENIETNGYAAVITSKSTFFKNAQNYLIPKENIFKKNTLKAVINMPKDLFEPNASTHTSIAVFQVGRAHNKSDEVYFII